MTILLVGLSIGLIIRTILFAIEGSDMVTFTLLLALIFMWAAGTNIEVNELKKARKK